MNILGLFDMDAIHREWPGPVDLFDQVCVEPLIGHKVSELKVPGVKGVIHNYNIEWFDV